MSYKILKTHTLSNIFAALILGTFFLGSCSEKPEDIRKRPNILLLMSDNHSWNHLSCYGDPVVKTPYIDSLAKRGLRFTNAYCAAPSCTPARASMLTGMDIWKLGEGANLWGTISSDFQVYTDLLEESGYLVGHQGKGWGPGNYEAGGWERNPAGNKFDRFQDFLDQREEEQPFTYWFSSRNPHRPYADNATKGTIDLSAIEVPTYLPDNDSVRMDMADYYAEIQSFDSEVGEFLETLKASGEMENTIIIVCSDNGWQMPRGLANLYTFGTKIPMVISMPERSSGARVINDFINLSDLAPTFLELAGLQIPKEMTAKSLVNILESDKSGTIEPERDFMVTGRERHAFVRNGGAGYGGRSIVTKDFLYIRNYEPEQWPAGDPPLYGDVDAHMLHYPSPTKEYMLRYRDNEHVKELFQLAFAKRPAEELFDLRTDPDQLNNVVDQEPYQNTRKMLADRLEAYLSKTGDPRVVGGEMKWMGAKYFMDRDKHPAPSINAQEVLGLKASYSYIEDSVKQEK
ncbi:MAG: sulfatase [Cytophagales bacterium]|uniref:sulfatase-like hydrolase/transferase n=1 Tax=Cyclobacterium marinum TaxID=104 RepID=UPI0030D6FF87|nr:sulfatase [Cytophagales bacterium]|tara:strand:- start:56819 stop:58366 length:1548 start_codon:yes stop_codon:yes gene_type:complete